jgi:hypothetical protein
MVDESFRSIYTGSGIDVDEFRSCGLLVLYLFPDIRGIPVDNRLLDLLA